MNRIQRLLCCLVAFWLGLTCALPTAKAGAVERFHITQVSQQAGDMLEVLFEALDSGSEPLSRVEPGMIDAWLGSAPLDVTQCLPAAEKPIKPGTAYILLIDQADWGDADTERNILEAYKLWISGMQPEDWACMIAVGSEALLLCDYMQDPAVLQNQLAVLQLDQEATALYDGLAKALDKARRKDEGLPSRRVIVTYSPGHVKRTGSLSLEELNEAFGENIAPLYVLSGAPEGMEGLGALARKSGGDLLQAQPDAANMAVQRAFDTLRNRLSGAQALYLDIAGLAKDSARQRLRLSLRAGNAQLEAMGYATLFPQPGRVNEEPANGTAETTTPEVTETAPGTPPPTATSDAEKPAKPTGVTVSIWSFALIPLVSLLLSYLIGLARKYWKKAPSAEQQIAAMERALVSEDPLMIGERTQPFEEQGPVVLGLLLEGPMGVYRQEVTLRGELLFGRVGGKVECALDDYSISAEHFRIVRDGNRILLSDAGSRNGTFINGARVTGETPLVQGDRIRAGKTVVRIEHM